MGLFNYLGLTGADLKELADNFGFGPSGAMNPSTAFGIQLLGAALNPTDPGAGSVLMNATNAALQQHQKRGIYNTDEKAMQMLMDAYGVRPSAAAPSTTTPGQTTFPGSTADASGDAGPPSPGTTGTGTTGTGTTGAGYASLEDIFDQGGMRYSRMAGAGLPTGAPSTPAQTTPAPSTPAPTITTGPVVGQDPSTVIAHAPEPSTGTVPAPEDQPQLNPGRQFVEVGPVDWAALAGSIPGVNAVRGLYSLGSGLFGPSTASAATPSTSPQPPAQPPQPPAQPPQPPAQPPQTAAPSTPAEPPKETLAGPSAPPGILAGMARGEVPAWMQQNQPPAGGDIRPQSTPEWGAGRDTGTGSQPRPPARWDDVVNYATSLGMDPRYVTGIARRESNFRPDARNPNSSAYGYFQITGPTLDGLRTRHPNVDLRDMTDPQTQVRAMALLTQDNAAYMRQALGREPTIAELGTAHYLGPAGAVDALRRGYDTQLSSFLPAGVMRVNPNLRGMTVGDLVGQYESMFNGKVTLSGGARGGSSGGAGQPSGGSSGGAGQPSGGSPASVAGTTGGQYAAPNGGEADRRAMALRAMMMYARAHPESAGTMFAVMARDLMKAPEAPTVRSFREGNETVERQWNARTGSWDVLSRGPAFRPEADPARGRDSVVQVHEGNQIVTYQMGPNGTRKEVGRARADEVSSSAREREAAAIMRENPGMSMTDALALLSGRGTEHELDRTARTLSSNILATFARGQLFQTLTDAQKVQAIEEALARMSLPPSMEQRVRGYLPIPGRQPGTTASPQGQSEQPPPSPPPSTALPQTQPLVPGVTVGPQVTQPQGAVPQPRTQAEFDALPSGALFRGTDGQLRRKP